MLGGVGVLSFAAGVVLLSPVVQEGCQPLGWGGRAVSVGVAPFSGAAKAKLLLLQTPDFRQELTQEQQLIPVLWTIGVLLGLNDRFEIENTHAELRDLKLS